MDTPVSIILAFIFPWALALLVHYPDMALSLACFFAVIVGIPVAYVSPFVYFGLSVREAALYETNFRLSINQMYNGDRLSKKETSILPATFKIQDVETSMRETLGNASASTDLTSMLSKREIDRPANANIPGSVRCRKYPTTRLLQQSALSEGNISSDQSANDGHTDRYHSCRGEIDSEATELVVTSEQAANAIETKKVIKIYNGQGNFAVK